ncbi:lanthionine synthetase C family protein [Streptomyces armeniacus]|uniref:Lanthionine synthetase C family protein n=1 Tax=Streptomyces armeniacus TaxID=83291 RepID=A0A345XY29_9ACTN|nr:lanthionine synthetase C family protein [Streptomyces armeniacus]AXK36545.1 lanthionine synthetase C family protein [Streptomyces armeniacus]
MTAHTESTADAESTANADTYGGRSTYGAENTYGTEDTEGRWDPGAVVAEVVARVRERQLLPAAERQEGDRDGGEPEGPNSPGLGGAWTGKALLLSEVSTAPGADPALRRAAHAALARAADSAGPAASAGLTGLYPGLGGLAFAAKHAARTPREYATLRTRLDAALRTEVAATLDAERARMADGEPGAPRGRFDVIGGMTGLGRYFLAEPADLDTVRDILGYLVALTEPVTVRGEDGAVRRLPGWYSPPWPVPPGAPPRASTDPVAREPVLDLGLAHGAAGPLALLSLCRSRGVRVPDQDTAIRRLADWLLSWRQHEGGSGNGNGDSGGSAPYWPALVTRDQEWAPVRPHLNRRRATWCYGTPGVARALQLAGTALGEEAWVQSAADGIRAVFRRPDGLQGVEEPGLCHGLAGVLQITGRMAADLDDPALAARADELAERVCAAFDPALPYGFATSFTPYDAPSTFLLGPAGIALALHGRLATAPRPPAPEPLPWDAALLLA